MARKRTALQFNFAWLARTRTTLARKCTALAFIAMLSRWILDQHGAPCLVADGSYIYIYIKAPALSLYRFIYFSLSLCLALSLSPPLCVNI